MLRLILLIAILALPNVRSVCLATELTAALAPPAGPALAPPADPLADTRYCTAEPLRDAQGRIARRKDVMDAFQRIHPCPVTGSRVGACPGWAKDHVIPLAVGGCDSVSNMQWLPDQIKRCAGLWCKDRFERKIYPLKQ